MRSRGADPISLTLFGAFAVIAPDQSRVRLRTNKSRALLAYLVLNHGQAVLRTTLTDLLWHGYTQKSALASLRQAIADLRELFGPSDLLKTDYRTVQLDCDPALVVCDVQQFDELFAACQRHAHASLATCGHCQSQLRQALQVYKGQFLWNLPLVDSPPFAEWVQVQRDHYAQMAAQIAALLAGPAEMQARVPGNLPIPLTPLLGRADELRRLAAQLSDPIYRCLTLIGPGGIGKTRLALALAAHQATAFPDGVWYVDLGAQLPAPVEAAADPAILSQVHSRLASAILDARGVALHGPASPISQMLASLQEKALLLILDSWENFGTGAGLLSQILQSAPGVRLLITSRQRPDLQGQLLHKMAGLAWPLANVPLAPLEHDLFAHYPSVQLFWERAALTQADLKPDAATLDTISAICRLVEGAPLALELAAALLDRYDLPAIARAIQDNYRELYSGYQDLPPRQRSVEAVMHTSWQLLAPQHAQSLACCAVFQGSFTPMAAAVIAGAGFAELDALSHSSLLQYTLDPDGARQAGSPGGRYRMSDLVRQFAADQLAQNPAVATETYARHAEYYLTLVAGWRPEEEAERELRAVVQPEIANVETAWDWALFHDQVALLLAAVTGLGEFYEMTSAFYAAAALFRRSVAEVRGKVAAGASASATAQWQTLLGNLLMQLSYVYSVGLGELEQAQAPADEALALALALQDARLTVRSYHALAAVAYGVGDYVRSQSMGEQGFHLARAARLAREEAMCLSAAGLAACARRDTESALRYVPLALALAQDANDARKVHLFRNQLGIVYRDTGDFSAALACFTQNLPATLASNDLYNIGLASANLGYILLAVGDFAAARTSLDDAITCFDAFGEKRLLTDCQAILGQLLLQQGDLTGAVATCRRILTQPALSRSAQHLIWFTLGEAYARLAEWGEAERAYHQLVQISDEPDAAGIRLLAQAGMAFVLLAQASPGAALAAVEDLLPHFDPALFDTLYSAPHFLLHACRVLIANDDPRAAPLLARAWQLVTLQAGQIGAPHLCHSFMENVPVHRQLHAMIGA